MKGKREGKEEVIKPKITRFHFFTLILLSGKGWNGKKKGKKEEWKGKKWGKKEGWKGKKWGKKKGRKGKKKGKSEEKKEEKKEKKKGNDYMSRNQNRFSECSKVSVQYIHQRYLK